MDFRKDALKMLNEMSGIVSEEVVLEKKTNSVDVDLVLKGLDDELSKENVEKIVELKNESVVSENSEIVEDFRPRFLGKLNESPNPQEYPNGTMYKDIRTGTVYIVENGLWESLVEDGKPGAQGRSGAAGSGTGVKEVESIIDNKITQEVLPQVVTISANTDFVSYIGSQAGWNQRILFAKNMGGANINATSETIFMTSGTGISSTDGNYAGSLYGIPPCIRANFIDSKSRWIKSHFMFGSNFGTISGVNITIKEYWGATEINTVTINYNDFPSPPTSGQNFPIELFSMYAWESGPASAATLRVHNYYVAYNAGTTGIVKCREKFPYPVVDLTKDNHICWKGYWSSVAGGAKLYIDFMQYTS